jgi:N-acetylglucosaminyldiphosphoundecaprenol N-acetyl-beta-D-mannosaminyltransferase
MDGPARFQRILGVRFFVGSAQGAIDQICLNGGIVVVPAAPALKNLTHDQRYREALLGADFAIPDSVLMVMIWNLMQRDRIPKLSGLKYLRTLIGQPSIREPKASFWVMPAPESARCNAAWLRAQGLPLETDDIYLAPMYGTAIDDTELLRRLDARRPSHIILALGGGTQERLAMYIKRHVSYKPAIHCVGAAIAFLSGDQVRIPVWVDEAGLGWLWRSVYKPRRYGLRYWDARHLAPLMLRYRDQLPLSDGLPLSAG